MLPHHKFGGKLRIRQPNQKRAKIAKKYGIQNCTFAIFEG